MLLLDLTYNYPSQVLAVQDTPTPLSPGRAHCRPLTTGTNGPCSPLELLTTLHIGASNQPTTYASVEDKVAWAIACTKHAGFSHVDEFFRIYYTESFDTLSSIHESQRISRTRELARTLQMIRLVSEQWPEQEKRPYRAEVFASAERFYTAELSKAMCQGKLSQALHEEFANPEKGALRQQKDDLQMQVSVAFMR